ncbi:MAG: hypothetical protein J4F28_02215 [Nitrosopumilaceae archaeon]|nr:hypothetical protein [Nitrosopumilaceae archaeon]
MGQPPPVQCWMPTCDKPVWVNGLCREHTCLACMRGPVRNHNDGDKTCESCHQFKVLCQKLDDNARALSDIYGVVLRGGGA